VGLIDFRRKSSAPRERWSLRPNLGLLRIHPKALKTCTKNYRNTLIFAVLTPVFCLVFWNGHPDGRALQLSRRKAKALPVIFHNPIHSSMRYLLFLILICCCGGLLSAQSGEETILLKSIKTTEGFLMPATEQNMAVMKGNQVFAAKGYELRYSKVTDMSWFQAVGAAYSGNEVLEAKKKKDKKKDKKKKAKPISVHLVCLSINPNCECSVINAGTADKPLLRCSSGCSCSMVAVPAAKTILMMETAGGDWFHGEGKDF
jgi:hypothetical protein